MNTINLNLLICFVTFPYMLWKGFFYKNRLQSINKKKSYLQPRLRWAFNIITFEMLTWLWEFSNEILFSHKGYESQELCHIAKNILQPQKTCNNIEKRLVILSNSRMCHYCSFSFTHWEFEKRPRSCLKPRYRLHCENADAEWALVDTSEPLCTFSGPDLLLFVTHFRDVFCPFP